MIRSLGRVTENVKAEPLPSFKRCLSLITLERLSNHHAYCNVTLFVTLFVKEVIRP